MTAWIDAGVVLRLLVNDVPDQHRQATELLRAHGPVRVSATALVKVIRVLDRGYGLTRKQQATAITGLLALPQVHGPDRLFEPALASYVKRPKVSFEDCLMVAEAELDGSKLWTLDARLSDSAVAE